LNLRTEGIQSRAQKPLIEDEGFLHFESVQSLLC
jgi:hypothetical protein